MRQSLLLIFLSEIIYCNMYRFRFLALAAIALLIFSSSCKKKVEVNSEPVPQDISRFIWNGMSDYYLWENNVTNRAGTKMVVHGVSVVRLKRGKIKQVRDYIFDTEKLPLAWCEKGEASQRTS